MKYLRTILPLCAVICLLSPAAVGDDADTAIARIIQDAATDADRAVELIEAAKGLDLPADVKVRMLEAGFDYALRSVAKPGGLQLGLDCLSLLEDKAPDRKSAWGQKRTDLYRTAFRVAPPEQKLPAAVGLLKALDAQGLAAIQAGDWAQARAAYTEGVPITAPIARRRVYFEDMQRWAAHFAGAERKAKDIAARLQTDPDNAALREQLIQTFVVSLDDPDRARPLLERAGQIWQTYVPMACRAPGELPEAACNELSKWYAQSLAAKTVAVGRQLMLGRAQVYARRAVELHTTKDLAFAEARSRLEKIDELLAQFQPAQRMLARLRYVDLMKLADLDVDATAGCWLPTKSGFNSSSRPDGTLRFPVAVEGAYRLTLAVAKTQGAPDLSFTFPVGDRLAEMTMREYYAPSLRPAGGGGTGRGTGRPGMSIRERIEAARRGGGGGGGWPGGLFPQPNVTWLRMKFDDLAEQRTASHAEEINPNYTARTWAPYTIEIAVQLTGDRVQIAATLNRKKWITWAGTRKGLSGASAADTQGAVCVKFGKPGVLVSSARLIPISGEVRYVRNEAGEALAKLNADPS